MSTREGVGSEFLPPCAQTVLRKEGEPTPEYWNWLIDQVSEEGVIPF